jgi:hypothetical protein
VMLANSTTRTAQRGCGEPHRRFGNKPGPRHDFG